VVSMRSSNTIHISETGKNVRRLAKIIQALDKEETLKSKKEVDKLNEKNKKLISKDKGYLDMFVKNSGLLMVAFMLIGLIIGFGGRGYMMKKVEGGW
jgi:ferritin-like metal-binding protein YciE